MAEISIAFSLDAPIMRALQGIQKLSSLRYIRRTSPLDTFLTECIAKESQKKIKEFSFPRMIARENTCLCQVSYERV